MTADLTSAIMLRPGDPGYDEAATTYMRTGRPALVVQPRSRAGVAAGIQHAVDHHMVLSVKSGGHSALAYGTNDGGVVIDLSGLDSIDVLDDATGRVRVGAGATWGEVATTLGVHGLSLTSGDTKSVGVGGLTVGGGIGWMVRNHGLTIDSLVAADIVTAAGEELPLNDDQNSDLFWAIRGGGGNFGVVTSFEFLAQRVTRVHAGTITYSVGDVSGLLRGWCDAHRAGPHELNSTLVLMPAFGDEMPAMAIGMVCYSGADQAAADAAFAPLLALDGVVSAEIAEKTYADVLEEAHPPPGVTAMATNTLIESVSDEVVAEVADWYAGGTAGRLAFVRALGGAVGRVSSGATAFAHRTAEAMLVGAAFLPTDATTEQLVQELRPFDSIKALGIGAYPGFLGNPNDDVTDVYPAPTLQRLREVKRRYDPTNVFSHNLNVRP
ncbi:MAG: FAD-binding oxidoreductase [Jiangellaceae bacterium]|nr:FAD-binding oxidoreductase [Jiangellaceae bacterium]